MTSTSTLSTTAITTTLPPSSSSASSSPNNVSPIVPSTSNNSSGNVPPVIATNTTGSMSNYNTLHPIGRGNFGVVFLAELKSDGRKYAVKQINLEALSKNEREGALQEVKLLSELRHQCIVSYRESFIEQDMLYVVMHYCDGGDLTSVIKNRNGQYFSEEQVLDWFVQLCLALQYCHHRRIIHRDLKSQNVFLTKKHNVRLGDFGIARVLNGTNEMAMTVVGTPYSMSPEVCGSKPYSFASDIWALGCVLYELCVLKHAFDSNNILGLVWKIVMETYPPIPNVYSENLSSLVNSMLDKDPTKRPTIDDILEKEFIRRHLGTLLTQKLSLRKQPKRIGTASGDLPSSRLHTTQRHNSNDLTQRPNNNDLTQQQPSSMNTTQQQQQQLTSMNTTQNIDKTSPARQPTLGLSIQARPITPPTPNANMQSTVVHHNIQQAPTTPKMVVNPPVTPTQQRTTPRTPTHSSSLPTALNITAQTVSKPAPATSQPSRRHSAIETTEYARLNAMTSIVSPRDQRDRVLEMKRARKEAEQKQYLAALSEAISTQQAENVRAADRAYHELHPSHQRPGTTSTQRKPTSQKETSTQQPSSSGAISARSSGFPHTQYNIVSPHNNTSISRHPDFRDQFDTSDDGLSPLPASPLQRRVSSTRNSISHPISSAQREYELHQQRMEPSRTRTHSAERADNIRGMSRDDRPIRSSGRYDFGQTPVDVQHSLYGRPEDSDYPDDFEDINTDDEDEQLVNILHNATIGNEKSYSFRGYNGTGVSPTASATTPRNVIKPPTPTPAPITKTSRSPSQPNIANIMASNVSPPSASTSINNIIQPSMSHKCQAIKRSALRQLTDAEFQEIYQFFKSKQADESTRGRGLPSPSGSNKVTKAELMAKFGSINSQAVFHIEQLVFLESLLPNGEQT